MYACYKKQQQKKTYIKNIDSSHIVLFGWDGCLPSCCLREEDVYTTRKAESQRSPRSPEEPWQQQTLPALLRDVINCLHHFESEFLLIFSNNHVFFNPQGVSYGKQLLMKTSEVLDGPRSCKTDPLLEPLPLSPVRRVGHRKPPCND